MTRRRAIWVGAIVLAYGALVALAYAVGPAPQSGCGIGGHGNITLGNGDRGTFSLLVGGAQPKGASVYEDLGPRRPMTMRSVDIAALTCTSTRLEATLAGSGRVTGSGPITYRVDVVLSNPAAAGADTYRITISNGYDSGTQPVHASDLTLVSNGKQLAHRAP